MYAKDKKTADKNRIHGSKSPVSVISLDLVDGDVQGSVGPLAHRQGLIDPKLCGCHCLTLRERRQVETKLLPVRTRLQEVTLLLHCRDGHIHMSQTSKERKHTNSSSGVKKASAD